MSGILGKKIGMTQVFDAKGVETVTVIEAGPCPVLSVRPKAVQVGFGDASAKRMAKPQAGMFAKLGVPPKKFIRDVARESGREYKIGEELKIDMFKAGDFVDVMGVSKGKGFQGGMKRWHWAGGPATHGHTSHRRIGSIGSTTTPGRVWKGHHLPGHMGDKQVTVQNVLVVKVDAEHNLLLLKGAVPGGKNSFLVINRALKRKPRAEAEVKAAAVPAAKKKDNKK